MEKTNAIDDYLMKDFESRIKELTALYGSAIKMFRRVQRENEQLKSEHYKDTELARMKKEYDELRKAIIFPRTFIDKAYAHAEKCGCSNVTGKFEIIPTHVAYCYKWTCPVCGKEFEDWF